ncbi:MAG: hypothetical protein QW505_06665, partial [Thermoplasmata archaeon]
MKASVSYDKLRSSAKEMRLAQRFFAIVACLVMVTTAFFTMVANADIGTAIWTSQDEYCPGDPVLIYGAGFLAFKPVTLTLTHPDFVWSDTVIPAWNGEFQYDKYISQWVSEPDVPVNVTAYQDESHQAWTQFWDPGVTVLSWCLWPQQRWMKGDIKGYNEGDSVPSMVEVGKPSGTDTVTVSIGLDFIDKTKGYDIYGFDYLTIYHDEPPESPFNIFPNSTTPFWVSPSEGTILSQSRMPNGYDSGGKQVIQIWNFTFQFAPGVETAHIRFGAHLALTNFAQQYWGASYYPGSNLHIRIVSISPPDNQGNRDVPFPVNAILTPPEMHLNKTGNKKCVIEGDIITFTITFDNTGQADAWCVQLDDWMPWVIDYVPGSAYFWTNESPIKFPLEGNPNFIIDGQHISWFVGTFRGCGDDFKLRPLIYYFEFKAQVNTSEEGCYTNSARLTYTDNHGGYFDPLWSNFTFCIKGRPAIDIEKTGALYAHVGDTVTYVYTVTNTGPLDLKNVDIIDNITGTIAV